MFSANQLAQEETVKVYFKTFLFEKCGKLESVFLTIYEAKWGPFDLKYDTLKVLL